MMEVGSESGSTASVIRGLHRSPFRVDEADNPRPPVRPATWEGGGRVMPYEARQPSLRYHRRPTTQIIATIIRGLRMRKYFGLVLLILLASATIPHAYAQHQDDLIDPDPQPRWFKGNLHTHSLWSDGNDYPE